MTQNEMLDLFRRGKIAVRVKKDGMMCFLEACEECGILWSAGERATEYVPRRFEDTGDDVVFSNVYGEGMTWCDGDEFDSYGYLREDIIYYWLDNKQPDPQISIGDIESVLTGG